MINKLPLLLYFADILSGLSSLLVAIIAISTISLLGSVAAKISVFWSGYESDIKKYYPPLNKFIKTSVVAWLIAVILQIALPSKGTIYAYAGINIANTVSNNPVVEKIERLVNKKLDEMLEEDKRQK